MIGTTDIGRYVDAFKAYSDIKEYLSEQKLLLLFPTYGLCPALTSLCLTNVVDLSIEFDKKVSNKDIFIKNNGYFFMIK